MNNIRLRCHFSIIFENLWQFWLVIILMIIDQIEEIIDIIESIGEKGIIEFLKAGGYWGVLVILVLSAIVFGIQFLRWRKTWIILEDNLVIIERNTLKRYKNTIAIENISAVNMERNLFERIVGTYKIKMDTNSMTTADKTDVSIVLREDIAVELRKTILERMAALKGGTVEKAVSAERQPDQLTWETAQGREVFHCTTKDMIKHSLYTLPLLSLLVVIGGIGGSCWYCFNYGLSSFIHEAVGGFIAIVIMVLGCLYNLFKRFLTYYDFTVYRDGKDLHVRCGLIKLRSYTVPVDKITAIEIEQPLISRIFHKYNAKVVTVGIGDEEGESSNITMSLSADELMRWLKALTPEYVWGEMIKVEKEESAGAKVRAVKSVKWLALTILAIWIMLTYTEAPYLVSIGVPAIAALFILLLYVLSHKAAGCMIRDEGMVVRSGYFAHHYSVFKYDRMQVMEMSYHPVAKRYDCGTGTVMLLNTAAGIPYIKKDLISKISDKMIGGTK